MWSLYDPPEDNEQPGSEPDAPATRKPADALTKGVTMLYSGDDFYGDDVTSGPQRRNDIEELHEREINFEEAAAEARAPLVVESADYHDDEGPEPDSDEGLNLPDPLDEMTDAELAALGIA